MEFLSGEGLAALLSVLFVNLVLSGDNAVVIAMAAGRLEGRDRTRAIVWGSAGAVLLKLLFAAVITFLLNVPFLQVAGALLLVWIAWRLFRGPRGKRTRGASAAESAWEAVRIIVIADAVMSLDNVIALVGAARIDGQVSFVLLAIGLATTVPLVVFGASLLTSLLERFPVRVYLGAGLLVFLAAQMVFQDVALRPFLEPYGAIERPVALAAAAVFLAVAWTWARRTRGGPGATARAEEGPNER